MIAELLPTDVAAAEAFIDAPGTVLFPVEEAAVGRAVAHRRAEFITGRRCARDALARLGFPDQPVPVGPSREPIWPPGVVGSITHCAGYRAAAVARATAHASLGIDAEPNEPMPPDVLVSVALPAETRWIDDLHRTQPTLCWDRLLFSAKESVYKAWFPLTRRWLDFHEALITADPATATFTAQLLVPGPTLRDGSALTAFTGRWLMRRGLLITAVTVPFASQRPVT